MKIFICTSKHNYHHVPEVQKGLELLGHEVTLPNCFDDPFQGERMRDTTGYSEWKSGMLHEQAEKIKRNDAILVLNMDKGQTKNYIGGATFLEIYKAFELGKKIFLYNSIPDGILHDEITGMSPVVIDGDIRSLHLF